MPGVTDFGTINTCTNQAETFRLRFTPPTDVDLTGAVVTCEIRKTAAKGTPLLTPTVETEMEAGVDGAPDVLVATFSWTETQAAVLVSRGPSFGVLVNYVIEIDIALADAPTENAMRFAGTLAVAPGGNTEPV